MAQAIVFKNSNEIVWHNKKIIQEGVGEEAEEYGEGKAARAGARGGEGMWRGGGRQQEGRGCDYHEEKKIGNNFIFFF